MKRITLIALFAAIAGCSLERAGQATAYVDGECRMLTWETATSNRTVNQDGTVTCSITFKPEGSTQR